MKGDDPQTEEAREVQSILATLGCDPGPVDGKPGRQTRDAIRRFQAEHQMTEDGHISPLLTKGLWAVATAREMEPPATREDAGRAGPTTPPATRPAVSVAPAVPAEGPSGFNEFD